MRAAPGPTGVPTDRPIAGCDIGDRRATIMGMGVIRIVLVDDHRAFVEALAERLGAEPGIEVVAATTDPRIALRAVSTEPVDVVLIDIDLGVAEDGITFSSALVEMNPDIHLVAVTCDEEPATVARALRAGFAAWVLKDVGVAVLLDAMRAVCRGETSIPGGLLTKVLQQMLREEAEKDEGQRSLESLTSRELDVLRWMARGAGRADIAQQLFISPNTVRTHMQSILAKLGVHSSLAAVALARRAGVG
jgi:DNA-binding NarL/FixJ family response regulator